MKKWLCFLLVGVLLLSLTACKKQNAGETGSTETTGQQTTANTESTHRQTTESTTENTQSAQTTESTENTQKQTTDHSYTLKDSSNDSGMKLLTITDDFTKETIQTLRLGECEWFTPEPIYTDITFDGHADILVPHQRTASGAYFAGFVWDGMAYVYTPGLENIPNIALDTENKMLLSCRTQSQITSYGMYRYDVDKRDFEIVRSLYWEPADSGVTVVESEYADGVEREVNRFTATAADDRLANYASDNLWGIESGKWRNWVYTP